MAKRSGGYWETKFEKAHVRPRDGRTLVVGSRIFSRREDRRRRYADAVGVDMQEGPGVDVVADLEEPRPELGAFAHIDCLSVLEHCRRPWVLAANLESMLETEGTIYVTAPFAWRRHAYPSDFWRFTAEAFPILFPRIEWDQISYASTRLWKGPAHSIEYKGHPFLPRTMVCAFGRLP